jgi:UDP-N-acetylmuramoyl-L-alanyl-D-glutamate--2,6-diaminopimelate ligase
VAECTLARAPVLQTSGLPTPALQHERPPTLGALLGIAGNAATVPVSGIATDSRMVKSGQLFFARPGLRTDGRLFIDDAISRGASAVVVPAGTPDMAIGVPRVVVCDFNRALGLAAAQFYGQPSTQLRLIGVTGTNGKTTVAHLISQAMNKIEPCGVLGTLGLGMVGSLTPVVLTTPDVTVIQDSLAKFYAAGARNAVMEVSSHGVAQGRIEGLAFETAVFTNLTRDHLDYHGDMRSYAAEKAKLFRVPELRHAIFNAEDTYSASMSAGAVGKRWWYGLDTRADESTLSGGIQTASAAGMTLEIDGPWGTTLLNSALTGRFNAENLLAALVVLLTGGMPLGQACILLGDVEAAPGRMQSLGGGDRPLVVVDYSHTPDSLGCALKALRPVAETLWCVFGCGGDRDKGKRAEMGAIAERLADQIVITDDNPRTELPSDIIEDIQSGLADSDCAEVISDRAQAIAYAVAHASVGDVVLVAGKGHESYQERDGHRTPFSDLEEAKAALTRFAAVDRV